MLPQYCHLTVSVLLSLNNKSRPPLVSWTLREKNTAVGGLVMPITQGIVEYFGITGSEHKCGYCKGMKPADSDYGMSVSFCDCSNVPIFPHRYRHVGSPVKAGGVPHDHGTRMEKEWKVLLSPDPIKNLLPAVCHQVRQEFCFPALSFLMIHSAFVMIHSCVLFLNDRCDAKDFSLSKSQRKCLKRVNRFLSDGIVPGPVSDRHSDRTAVPESMPVIACPDLKISRPKVTGKGTTVQSQREHASANSDEAGTRADSVTASITPDPEVGVKTKSSIRDASNKAKTMRIERKMHKVMLKENCSYDMAQCLVREAHVSKLREQKQEQELLDRLLSPGSGAKHRIDIKLVRTSFDSGSEKEAAFHDTILPVEHAVYSRYQMIVHKDEADECTKKQFKRFLCDTPLSFAKFRNGMAVNEVSGFGSYHMQYWLDGEKLIAVGVIDILPSGLSSVYFFYDPDFSFLGLGTYSALRELALVRNLNQQFLPCRYYYMGFYIHSCPKMRYKGKFLPSDLLCPEVRTWQPIQQAVRLLDVHKYSRLDPNEHTVDEESRGICDQQIGVVIAGHGSCDFFRYQIIKSEDTNMPATEEKVREYASLVGKKAAKSLLLYLE